MARSYRTRTLGPSVYRRPAREAFRSRRLRSIPGPLGHVGLVVGDPASLNGTDTAWRDWIQDLGFTVTFIDDVSTEDKNFDLICVSESSASGQLDPSGKYLPDTAGDPPVIFGEQGAWDRWGFSSAVGAAVPTGTTVSYVTGADDYVDWTGQVAGAADPVVEAMSSGDVGEDYGSGTFTITEPAGTVSGDLLVLACHGAAWSGSHDFTEDTTTDWTEEIELTNNDMDTVVFTHRRGGSAPGLTFDRNGATNAMWVCYRVSSAGAISTSGGTETDFSSPTSPGTANMAAGDLGILVASSTSPTAIGLDVGLTALGTGSQTDGGALALGYETPGADATWDPGDFTDGGNICHWIIVKVANQSNVEVYTASSVPYEIIDANIAPEVISLVRSPGNTGTIVGYVPVGYSGSVPGDPFMSPAIFWGLSGNGAGPTNNANAAHEQLFKDCVLTLTNHQTGAGLWQGIAQRSELAWRANEASPDTDATTVTSLANQGQVTDEGADAGTGDGIDGTPTKEVDYFATDYDAIEFVGNTERIDNSGGPLSRAIDTKSAGVTMWWIGEWASFTAASNFVFRLSRGDNDSRLSIEKDSTQHFGMRSAFTTSYSTSTFSADTPYLIVAYWDPTAVTNNWLEVNGTLEMSGGDFTGDTLLDWDVTQWQIPNNGGSVDTSRWHASGVVLGEPDASLKADLWTYAQLAGAGGGDNTATPAAINPTVTVTATGTASQTASPVAINPTVTVTATATGGNTATTTAINPSVTVTSNGLASSTASPAAINPTVSVGATGSASSTASPAAINPTVTVDSIATASQTASPAAVEPTITITATGSASQTATPLSINPAITVTAGATASSVASPVAINPTVTVDSPAIASSVASPSAINPTITVDSPASGTSGGSSPQVAINPTITVTASGSASQTASPVAINPNVEVDATGRSGETVTPTAINPTITVTATGSASQTASPGAINPAVNISASATSSSAAVTLAVEPVVTVTTAATASSTASPVAIEPVITVDASATGGTGDSATPVAIEPTITVDATGRASQTASPAAIEPTITLAAVGRASVTLTPVAIAPSVTVDASGTASSTASPAAINPNIQVSSIATGTGSGVGRPDAINPAAQITANGLASSSASAAVAPSVEITATASAGATTFPAAINPAVTVTASATGGTGDSGTGEVSPTVTVTANATASSTASPNAINPTVTVNAIATVSEAGLAQPSAINPTVELASTGIASVTVSPAAIEPAVSLTSAPIADGPASPVAINPQPTVTGGASSSSVASPAAIVPVVNVDTFGLASSTIGTIAIAPGVLVTAIAYSDNGIANTTALNPVISVAATAKSGPGRAIGFRL